MHSARVGGSIKQTTLLNLGSHFDLPQAHWPALAQCIDELVHGQRSMLEASLPEEVWVFAQRFAAQIIARRPAAASIGAVGQVLADPVPELDVAQSLFKPAGQAVELGRYQEVDLDSLELAGPAASAWSRLRWRPCANAAWRTSSASWA